MAVIVAHMLFRRNLIRFLNNELEKKCDGNDPSLSWRSVLYSHSSGMLRSVD